MALPVEGRCEEYIATPEGAWPAGRETWVYQKRQGWQGEKRGHKDSGTAGGERNVGTPEGEWLVGRETWAYQKGT